VKLLAVWPTDGGALLAERLALDPEPGFACAEEVEPELAGPSTLLGTWLPGSDDAREFPAGAGLAVQAGAVFVLVVHYHPPGSDGLSDLTSVDLWLEPEVERAVDVVFARKPRWTLTPERGGLVVPAGRRARHRWGTRVGALNVGAWDPELGGDLLSASFHMHRLGARGRLSLSVDGEERVLLDIPRWDVDWQLEYWPVEPVRLGPDDELVVECWHDNAAGEGDVTWGDGSDDEMCAAMISLREPAGP
jgi:hypothetical protein